MYADSGAFYVFDDSVDEFGSKFEFLTRIPAGSKGCSHKRTPFALL